MFSVLIVVFNMDVEVIIAIVVIVICIIALVIWFILILFSWMDSRTIEEGYKSLSNGFNSGSICDESDIKVIYDKRIGKSLCTYVSFIEGYREHLINGHKDEVKDFEKVRSTIKSIEEREKQSEPYSGLDESERKAMLTIEKLVKQGNSQVVVKDNLRELSNSIRAYKQEIKKKAKLNNSTIPVGVLGLLLSAVTFIWGSKLSNKDKARFDDRFTAIEQGIDSLAKEINKITREVVLPNEDTNKE